MARDETIGEKKTLGDLLAVMAALRAPGTGCPWDLAQTFTTIAPYTIEEAYEVADAISRGDMGDLRDELGDLLFQVVYHARMAEEAGAFNFADVADAITAKMLRRHPHVFGTEAERAAGAAPGFWERIKSEERGGKAGRTVAHPVSTVRDSPPPSLPRKGGGTVPLGSARSTPQENEARAGGSRDAVPPPLRASLGGGKPQSVAEDTPTAWPSGAETPSLLADVPVALPALTRAIKLQNKAAKVGFDWPSLVPVFAKMREELAELEEVVSRGVGPAGSDPTTAARIEEELGDLLFVVANVARHLEIDPEGALRTANEKFIRRFRSIEAALAAAGRSPEQSSLDEMDRLWDEAKARERST